MTGALVALITSVATARHVCVKASLWMQGSEDARTRIRSHNSANVPTSNVDILGRNGIELLPVAIGCEVTPAIITVAVRAVRIMVCSVFALALAQLAAFDLLVATLSEPGSIVALQRALHHGFFFLGSALLV